MLKIESLHNDTFKRFLSLTHAKGLKKEKLFLLSGEKLIQEFLKAPAFKIVAELMTSQLSPLVKTTSSEGTQNIQLSTDLFAQIDVLGTHFNILVLEQPAIPTLSIDDLETYKPHGIEVVIPIGDPGNLGALIRSCEAFAVPGVILTQEAAHPFLPKAIKASAGSVLRLPLIMGPALHAFPIQSIALDMHGTSIYDFTWPETGLLVVGEEGPGLGDKTSKHLFQQCICIPTQGVESLNVVVAASIALAHKMRSTCKT